MTIAVRSQGTAAPPERTGALTVPIQIVRTARARHRVAVRTRRAAPAWALLAAVLFAGVAVVIAVTRWDGAASVAVITMSTIAVGLVLSLDLIAFCRKD